MRTDTQAFKNWNQSPHKEPRYVVEFSFTPDNSDLVYFTSHADAALPGAVQSILGVIDKRLSGTSQKLDTIKLVSTIGNINIGVIDKANAVTDLLNAKLALGKNQKGMRARVYLGYSGLAWADYTLIATQLVQNVIYKNGGYTYQCHDIQRQARKDVFDVAKTTLNASITDTQLTIPAGSVTAFQTLPHGTSYSDAPNATVLYIKIEDEILRCTGTSTTDPTYGNVFIADQRGALNTKAVEHNIDTTASTDRRTKIEEVVYLEMPVLKLIYALLTGALYGQGAATLPDTWHLGINAAYIALTEFTAHLDIWNTADDTDGIVARFVGLTKVDGKRFIEEQLLVLIAGYLPVLNDGSLGFRRLTKILADAAYVRQLDTTNIVGYGDLTIDHASIRNILEVLWNYDEATKDYTRRDAYLDSDSIALYDVSEPFRMELRGLHGSRHTSTLIGERFDALRDRYSGPPLRMDLTLLPSQNDLEVGDVVRVVLDTMRDYIAGGALDRSFEIQQVRVDWITGLMNVSLFGSSRSAAPLTRFTNTTVLANSFYSSAGTNIQTYLDANYPGTFTVLGGVGHISGTVTLPGNASLNNATAIYYYPGDLTIDAGAVVNTTLNVQLRAMGHFTIDGTINAAGQGIASNGGAGFIGTTESVGGMYAIYPSFGLPPNIGYSNRGTLYVGANDVAPFLNLINGTTSLVGLPDDLRGTAGGQGGAVTTSRNDTFPGAAGGASGGGLAIVSRGASFGVNGSINVSGAAGTGATAQTLYADPAAIAYPGAGAGGAPGAVYFLIDGAAAVTPTITNVTANQDQTPQQGAALSSAGFIDYSVLRSLVYFHSYYSGIGSSNRTEASVRIQYIPPDVAAQADADSGVIAAPTGLAAASGTNELILESDGTIVVRAKLNWTSSTDVRAVGYESQFKPSAESIWIQGPDVLGRGTTQVYIASLESGVNYDFRIRAADNLRHSSNWLTITAHTVAGKTQPPADVPAFNVYQNGEAAVMKWNPVADADLAGYAIRYGPVGGTWADATPLTEITRGTNVTTADVPSGSWTFHIKAVDTSGNYSVNSTTSNINFVSQYDIITQQQQSPGWLGVLNGFVKHWTGVLLPADQYTADYYTNFEIFDTFVPTPVVACTYDAPEIDIGFDDDARAWGDITSNLGPGVVTGVANPSLQLDYKLAAGAYDGFENWSVGVAIARYFKFRLLLDPAIGKAVISAFKPTVDNIEFTQKGANVVVGASGATITYPLPYHLIPYVHAIAVSATALYITLTTITTTSFIIHVFNAAGTEVGGTINWEATGV
jgi:hypothetical protein